MCGIAGYINLNSKHIIDKELINSLKDTIKHRGPDADEVYLFENIALAHTRLSIIDLETGSQPMYSYNKQCVLVFNGEIYNHIELRSELETCGHKFLTSSDTEVILNSYLEWGVNCFNRFNGEWAFALWDTKKKTLLLSRDRYGIKPLYYKLNKDESLTFSSEIKSFKVVGDFEIDKKILWDLLVFGPKPGGKTHIKGINELHPGNYIIISKDKIKIDEYYKLENSLEKSDRIADIELIEEILKDSIKKRLMADVKVGTINSGGLDSSLVSKIANDYLDKDLFTFSVAPKMNGKEVLSGDESNFARILSDQIKSKHSTIRYSLNSFISQIKNCLLFNDGPLFHSNSIPLSYMFKKIRYNNGIKVILGGEGADEVFRGYSVNQISFINSKLKTFGLNLFFKILLKYKYPRLKLISKLFNKLSFYAHLAIDRNMHLDPEIADKLLDIKGEISNDRLLVLKIMKTLPVENQLIYYEQKCYLAGLLQRVDRMSMRWGVEARVPFLDHRLVEYMNSIAPKLKNSFTEKSLKSILKKISKKHINSIIVNRKKYGFSSPLETYKSSIDTRLASYLEKHCKLDVKELDDNDTFLVYNYYLLSEQNIYQS